jgi:hypothetical protein
VLSSERVQSDAKQSLTRGCRAIEAVDFREVVTRRALWWFAWTRSESRARPKALVPGELFLMSHGVKKKFSYVCDLEMMRIVD